MNWEDLCKLIQVPTPILDLGEIHGVRVKVKRDDLTHPEISGNKWRKLKYNLKYCLENGYSGIISFGGAFSNHVYSLSSACFLLKIPLIVIIRGEEVNENNSTLKYLLDRGQTMVKVNRSSYKLKLQSDEIKAVIDQNQAFYIIPEGGTNDLALEGVKEVGDEIVSQDTKFDHLLCSLGTGGTAAGLLQSNLGNKKLVIYPALRGDWMVTEIKKLLPKYGSVDKLMIRDQYHFGGYAKGIQQLLPFIEENKAKYQLPLDPIYTSKMWYGMLEDIKNGFYPKGSTLMFYHSGGLQGVNVNKE
jgi:1-aminocyclopropane-1-carboxylate deaminase